MFNESPEIVSCTNHAKNNSKASEAGIGKNFGRSQGGNVLETKKWLIIPSGEGNEHCLRYASCNIVEIRGTSYFKGSLTHWLP